MQTLLLMMHYGLSRIVKDKERLCLSRLWCYCIIEVSQVGDADDQNVVAGERGEK